LSQCITDELTWLYRNIADSESDTVDIDGKDTEEEEDEDVAAMADNFAASELNLSLVDSFNG
jgi:hypothetical protein